jgi:hypothetical protein
MRIPYAAEPGCRPGRSRRPRASLPADRALIQISWPGASLFSFARLLGGSSRASVGSSKLENVARDTNWCDRRRWDITGIVELIEAYQMRKRVKATV